jgi:hypothetical protein
MLLLVTANVVPGSPILANLMMSAIGSSETSVFTTATRRHISEDDVIENYYSLFILSLKLSGSIIIIPILITPE